MQPEINSLNFSSFSVQRDGFIVPIHGSLINCKPKNNIAVYKTSKKRWLETFIQEGGSKCMSPAVSPRHLYSPTRENITPEKEMSSPGSQVCSVISYSLKALDIHFNEILIGRSILNV